jgi:hypothetical protein
VLEVVEPHESTLHCLDHQCSGRPLVRGLSRRVDDRSRQATDTQPIALEDGLARQRGAPDVDPRDPT